MIQKEQVMPIILEACNSYRSRWEEYYSDSYSEGEEQLLYIDLSDFARYVIDLYKEKKMDSFDSIFKVVERLQNEGDEYVKEAIVIGFLEDLQNIALGEKIDLAEFEQFLGVDSKKWWVELNKFWSGKIKYVGETFKG